MEEDEKLPVEETVTLGKIKYEERTGIYKN